MIQRYLGNKQVIAEPLLRVIGSAAEPGDHVVDIFSGSLTVSLALKAAGYTVTPNDVNLFSHVISEALLVPSELPTFDMRLIPSRERRAASEAGRLRVEAIDMPELTGRARENLAGLLAGLEFLAKSDAADLPNAYRMSHFYDTYCEEGERSAFVSSRGSVGRRRFFSAENARRLDGILNRLRFWNLAGALPSPTLAWYLVSLMRGMEKVSNTQGTYHDFPRTAWDSRASKPLELQQPPLEPILQFPGKGQLVGPERDSLEAITDIPHHAVLYLDPPYNFRQYTAYYFMLNLVCRYPTMPDPDAYFAKVKFVRGQNPDDDFTSSFCKAKSFVPDLGRLIRSARCETVVLSYFTGKNHWSDFDGGRSDTGLGILREMLSGADFVPGSLTVHELERLNYASYGGYKARSVQELILVARKVGESANQDSVDTDAGIRILAGGHRS